MGLASYTASSDLAVTLRDSDGSDVADLRTAIAERYGMTVESYRMEVPTLAVDLVSGVDSSDFDIESYPIDWSEPALAFTEGASSVPFAFEAHGVPYTSCDGRCDLKTGYQGYADAVAASVTRSLGALVELKINGTDVDTGLPRQEVLSAAGVEYSCAVDKSKIHGLGQAGGYETSLDGAVTCAGSLEFRLL